MKKRLLSLFSFAFIMANVGHAQDMAVETISLNQYAELKSGTTRSIAVSMTVFEAIPANTTLSFYYEFDNNGVKAGRENLTINQNVPVGGDINPVPVPVEVPMGMNDTVTFKMICQLTGDTNPDNDTLTTQFIIKDKVANDISVSIVSPTDGSEQRNWTQVPFNLEITNEGTTTLNSGTPMIIGLTVDNQQQGNPGVVQYNGDALQPGASTNVMLNINLPRNFPLGSANICIAYIWAVAENNQVRSIDGNTADNSACVAMTVVQNDVNEAVVGLGAMYVSQKQLNLELENRNGTNQYRFEVVSMTGQQISTSVAPAALNTTHQIDLQRAQSGMYILNIYADDKYVGSEKFMVR